jgi:mono/diheme cytochrome c family protein
MRAVIATVVTVIAIQILGGFGFVYSGIDHVGATDKHWDPTYWLLDTARTRSIKVHAAGIRVPPGLDDHEKIVMGTEHFAAHCAVCHGAPGVPRGEIAKGFYPKPPNLADAPERFTPAELFWILKNGIKASGMPSWQDHSDNELWATVAFIEKLPRMTPEEYGKLVMVSIAQGGHQHRTGGEPSGPAPPGSEQAISPDHPGPALSIGGAIRQVLPSIPGPGPR